MAETTAAGGLAAGDYYAGYTWVDAFGETTLGASESTLFTSGGATKRYTVTIPSLPTGAQSANIYVTPVGGASGSETIFATGITATTFALTDAAPVVDQPGAVPPSANTTGAAFHSTLIYSLFGYGNERNIQMTRMSQDLSNFLSGYPIERRMITMNHLRWAGVTKLWYTAFNEIGTLIAANMPTAITSTADPRGMPKQRWTLP